MSNNDGNIEALQILSDMVDEREEELKKDYSESFDKLLCDYAQKIHREA